MQAHPLSNTAARNLNHSGPSSIAEGPGLAHDAGNLLEALVLYCDLLALPGVLRPEHRHYAHELKLLSQRSGVLIHRLLSERREDDAPPAPHLVERPLQRLFPSTVVHAFAPLLRSLAAPEVVLTVDVAPDLPPLPFAAEVLERILVNLTRNAVTALHRQRLRNGSRARVGGHIHIAVYGDAETLSLAVTDNGPGMPPEMVTAFLQPTPLPQQALAGIGHRVVHELVRSSAGTLSITVVPDRETTVRIDWPCDACAPDENINAERGMKQDTEQSMDRALGRVDRKGIPISC